MQISAKHVMATMQIGGLGLALYGWQADAFAAVVFGLAIAIIGGTMGRMRREDDAARR